MQSDSRFEFRAVDSSESAVSVPEEVLRGLSSAPKSLPCKLFYDAAGSELFERICALPEYYLTRTEQAILCRVAGAIARAAGPVGDVVELGSGSSRKTRILLEAFLDRQSSLRYAPVDISAGFLRESAIALLAEYPSLSVSAVAGEYSAALGALPERAGMRLFLFLGSNIGNFHPVEASRFLGDIRAQMQAEDRILLGVDRVKEPDVLEAAYNDSAGITAEFNLNLLRRINSELGGGFDLGGFRHHAPYLPEESRIEMRLISLREQVVPVSTLDRNFRFAEGEYIHTENSYKYALPGFEEVCAAAGLTIGGHWRDERDWFSVFLLKPDSAL